MNNYMKTIISGLKQWVSSQKSDWKQNDSSAPNYVKNRTHYEENKEIIIFPETTFVTEDWDGVYGFETTPTSYPLKAKQSYTIILDGNNYIVSALISPYDDEGFYLGNTMLLDGDDTKEPFGIMIGASRLAIVIITDTEPTEHTLEIKGQETVIHKLDKKYLPDDLIPESALVEGDRVSRLWNDSLVSYTRDQSLEFTNEQKVRARNNIGAGTSNFSGNYNDLTDKPIYKTIIDDYIVCSSFEFNNPTILDSTATVQGPIYRYGPVQLSSNRFPNPGDIYEITINNEVYRARCQTGPCFGNKGFVHGIDTGENFYIAFVFVNGTFMLYTTTQYDTVSLSIIRRGSTTYHQLDENYIPDTIARVGDIPEVPTKVSELENDAGYITKDNIPETPNIDETQIINDIYSFEELTNPNIGIIYRSNSGNEAGFLNVLDTIPIKEDSMPEILVFNTYDIKSGVITYYAESAGTETLTINFNDNTITGVDFNGIVSTNTLNNYSAETGYGNTIVIKVADIWSANCKFDFYPSVYKAVSSDINNVYEGTISQIATKAYVNNNGLNYATAEDVLYILNEIGAIKPITTSDGKILTDNNGAIYSL